MNRLRSMKKRYMISIALMMIIALLFAYRTYAFTFQTNVSNDMYEASGAACRSIPLKLSSYYTRCFQAES